MSRRLDPAQYLPALAVAAAKRRRKPRTPLKWSEALAEAPWGQDMPPAWEREFRRAYATELVGRGYATEAAPSGGAPQARSGSGSTLTRKTFRATDQEFAEQAEVCGPSWNDWARRVLAAEVERTKRGR